MKPYQWLMAAGLLGAAGLAFFGDKTPSSEVAEPAERGAGVAAARAVPAARAAATPSSASVSASSAVAVTVLGVLPRAQLVGESDAEFSAKDGVFQSQNWMPPPPAPAMAQQAPPPPPAPSAPPLPFTVIGKAVGDGSWEVFLARADKTYVVRLHTVIDGQYRVETIAPPTMTLTYLPLKQVQQINIGVLD